MEGGRGYDDSCIREGVPSSSEVLESLWVPCSSPIFPGSTSMVVNFEDMRGEKNCCERKFFEQIEDKFENGNEEFDGCFHQPEKKRRLLPDQVHFLEKSFEVDNKLEPDRKLQLAKELGLQPRQVAIWFQNRRARYKTKHIEKEYDVLKASYDKLQADYDALYKENENLKNQVHLLSEKLLIKPKLESSDPIGQFDLQPKTLTCACAPNSAPEAGPDAATSAKSDVIDPDSPHYADGNDPALLEPADSSHIFEQEYSDFSQDEDDSLNRGFLSSSCFPKLELECFDELQPNSCSLGLPIQDQGTWAWPY